MTIGTRINNLTLAQLWAELEATKLPRRLFELALLEDCPDVDLTTAALPEEARAQAIRVDARLRQPATVAGLAALPQLADVFGLTPHNSSITLNANDGAQAAAGDTLFTIEASAEHALRLERTMLNLISRMCGVATRTRAFVDAAVAGGAAKVCETRKTTPGLRVLEKYAVRCGGGWLHRMSLSDAVLIKDNHIAAAIAAPAGTAASTTPIPEATITALVRDADQRWRRTLGPDGFLQVEVDTLEQLDQVLSHAADVTDIVLLDNMTSEQLRQAIKLRNDRAPSILLEASGNVSLETIAAIAATGVDRISVGGLTHQATSIDIGLDAADT
ncbi:MAG: nicotinate-nucleotide diphosphorylase [Planctomycetota bacterium]